jgi:excisionase family DNA binding protein
MPSTKTAPALEPFALTIPQACDLSGLGRSSLYLAIKNGELQTLRIGDRRLVEPEELRRWLLSKRQSPERSVDRDGEDRK